MGKRLRELKDRKDTLEGELKELDQELKTLTTETLPAAMDENDIEKFTVEGVGTIYQQVKVYAYVKKENEPKFHAWLREQGHGDMIREYVFPATLSSFAKEQIEAGVELPDFLPAAKVPTAMLRRSL
jgi:seryl-tRNA synthetase